ncbi:acyl carrier protein-like protein [Cokeromyces recurvatus]|uniref:acyl carrier protein-like protein n=1 Tax=Cokeromyces recurvatus TaxID=90255 RepID=UPI0022210DF9|nr:acyl carrier protein-like protein [Cokeromyces recurvatus]KAI7902103.1 acyl carrier protein-like protein [Cokeromyces recurvatus]
MFLRPNVILSAASRAATTQRPSVVRLATPAIFSRMYASLPKEDVQTRVMEVVKSFDKVDPSKVTLESNFIKDLGLDSLDTVEVVMAIEEEFSVEIPDKDADAIHSVQQAIDYIIKREDAH